MGQNKETLVGKIIHEKLPIEWMRYNMFLTNNKYKSIPMLVFRVQESCPEELIKKIENSIATFDGSVKWKMFKNPLSRSGNYLITISELEDMYKECYSTQKICSQEEYLGIEVFRNYCECAIQDIPELAKHITDYFS